jgi:hypothetical protein
MKKRKDELAAKLTQNYKQQKDLVPDKAKFDAAIAKASQPIQKEKKTKD